MRSSCVKWMFAAMAACSAPSIFVPSAAAATLAEKLSTPEAIGATLAVVYWAEPRCTQLEPISPNIALVLRMGKSALKARERRVAQGMEERERQLKVDWKTLGPDGACIKLALTEPELFLLKK